MLNPLVIALFCFILWLSCIADITSMRQLIVFLSYYCRMTEYMAHFVNSAHWLVEQCIVGKLQHHFYDTDIFLFFISYCPHHFF